MSKFSFDIARATHMESQWKQKPNGDRDDMDLWDDFQKMNKKCKACQSQRGFKGCEKDNCVLVPEYEMFGGD